MVSRHVSGTFACRGERKGQVCCRQRSKGDKGLRRGWGLVLNPKAQPCPATGLKERLVPADDTCQRLHSALAGSGPIRYINSFNPTTTLWQPHKDIGTGRPSGHWPAAQGRTGPG